MNKSKQDPKIISIFEIIGSYFTDVIFNHIYRSAKNSQVDSLTDTFRKHIHSYVMGIKTDHNSYSNVIMEIHRYFQATTAFTTLSFAGFVDKVTSICVPNDYFEQFTSQDKDEILSSIVSDLIANLATYSTQSDMLRKIIDTHTVTPDVTIRMLQDASISILLTKRENIMNRFMKKQIQSRDSVSMDVVEDMKEVIRKLVIEKSNLSMEIDKYKDIINNYKTREAKFTTLIEGLKKQLSPPKKNQHQSPIQQKQPSQPAQPVRQQPLPIQQYQQQLPVQQQPLPIQQSVQQQLPIQQYQQPPTQPIQQQLPIQPIQQPPTQPIQQYHQPSTQPVKIFEQHPPTQPVKIFEQQPPTQPVKIFEQQPPTQPVKIFEQHPQAAQYNQFNNMVGSDKESDDDDDSSDDNVKIKVIKEKKKKTVEDFDSMFENFIQS